MIRITYPINPTPPPPPPAALCVTKKVMHNGGGGSLIWAWEKGHQSAECPVSPPNMFFPVIVLEFSTKDSPSSIPLLAMSGGSLLAPSIQDDKPRVPVSHPNTCIFEVFFFSVQQVPFSGPESLHCFR